MKVRQSEKEVKKISGARPSKLLDPVSIPPAQHMWNNAI